MLRTLALLTTVAQTTARANNAPVCAIGLKKGARVRLPGGARRASPALQIRVRKQLPIPIIPGAHVATLKNCHKDVGAFRQTCCALPAALPFVHNGTEHFNTTAVAGQVGALPSERCLPSLIIGGVQKAGSTALAALLAGNPSIKFGPGKELHYFDQGFCRGTLSYLARLPPFDTSDDDDDFVTAEATPFYIASPNACGNMARELPESAKLIIVVREPVARLYSEYQMERRRTVPQKRFLNKLREHAASLLLCYARNSGALPTNETFAQCVGWPRPFCRGDGASVPPRHRRDELSPSTQVTRRAGTTSTQALLQKDREDRIQLFLAQARRAGDALRLNATSSIPAGRPWIPGGLARWFSVCFRAKNASLRFDAGACARVAIQKEDPQNLTPFATHLVRKDASKFLWCVSVEALRNDTGLSGLRDCLLQRNASLQNDARFDVVRTWTAKHLRGETGLRNARLGSRRLSTMPNAPVAKLVVACFTPFDNGGLTVNLGRCYPTRTLETLVPKEALSKEADELEACALNEIGKKAPRTPNEAHVFLSKCKPRTTGSIQRDFVYRSLYAAQLLRCEHQGFPRSRTMIVDGDDLRRDAPSVVGEVERFVGLPPQPPLSAEDVTETAVRKKIAKTFPSFDERIGWSIHGVYDDEGLPVEVEERLSAFFRPHDDAFFEILGRRLAWRT